MPNGKERSEKEFIVTEIDAACDGHYSGVPDRFSLIRIVERNDGEQKDTRPLSCISV